MSSFRPVFRAGFTCIGFILRTCRGLEAMDVAGKPVGTYDAASDAVAHLRQLAAEPTADA
jgi:hypothetical protein